MSAIIAFALATTVPLAVAGVLWLRLERLALSIEALKASISALPNGTATTRKLAEIENEVAALIVAHEAMVASNRKHFGKIWGTIGDKKPRQDEPETADEVRARLRTEHNLPRFGTNGSN